MTTLAVALALLVLVSGSPAFAQTAPDPQALVGEWAGVATRIAPRAGASRATYMLTIEKVEGAKVYGHADTLGSGPPASFVGTLRGNTLTFYSGRFETALTLAGKRLYWLRRGGADNGNPQIGLRKVGRKGSAARRSGPPRPT